MDKAKQAVSGFLSKDGKHDTTVHETVNPAVQNEHVTKTHHENVTKAVDREVHQDHHHTSVQPIKDKEVLPEQHTHNMAGVEHREINHGNDDHVRQRLEAERAQFKNTREVGETQHTASAAPSMAGEHVHHHVHETIQPVIQKETIQPSVVHTTVPVHEVHHNEAKHHTASALPAVTMDEFKHKGGSIGGREERVDSFGGEPRTVGSTLGGHGAKGTTSLTEPNGGHHHNGNSADHNLATGTGPGMTGNNVTSGGVGSTGTHTGAHGDTTTHKKPSLMDKLNPKIDADGDGKAGFMK